ncbi:MAG: hypothetical protein AAFR61_07625 [Bacteroidota bacterium]
MSNKTILFVFIALMCGTFGCGESTSTEPHAASASSVEKAAILATLNEETAAFFLRDYQAWQECWLHESFIAKSYMILTDSSLSETLGWEAIDDFGRTYLSEHPEPETPPQPLEQAEIRLYGTGAWVTYEQDDPARGPKRESRLMEKVEGKWKIAGMQTTIYGKRK